MNPPSQWLDIATFDRRAMQFVLVSDGDVVRLRLWNSFLNRWENDKGYPLDYDDECHEPTLWMPIPPFAHEL